MEIKRTVMSVKDILDLFRNGMLRANPEYQRGVVWSLAQRKKLIDSVLRGYPLPLIYLHHIEKTVAGMRREDLEIIDGQQRITSLYQFAEGAFKLFDPVKDDSEARFPNFIKKQVCSWGRKDIHTIGPIRERFEATELAIVKVITDNANEVRDLFVRLQSGLPLNSQETRDAWPGDFTDYVLRLGGKPEIARFPGHPFFRRLMKMKPEADRGKTRQLAAQLAMLFFSRKENGPDDFVDINSGGIDNFYYAHLDFDSGNVDAKRLTEILDKLDSLIGDGKRPKLRAHDAIHLVLLIDSLWDDYTRSWEVTLPAALDKFALALNRAKEANMKGKPDEYWLKYGQWTRVNSDRGDRIRSRHAFYTEKMLELLGPLTMKDPKRAYGPLEREILYFRDNKKCKRCGADVPWSEAEIHHIKEHHKGGPTDMENAALVHRHCHPKGAAAAHLEAQLSAPK